MIRRRLAPVAGAALALAALPGAAQARIGPFTSVAGIRLGMTPDEIPARLGTPARTDDGRLSFAGGTIDVTLVAGRVARVTTSASDQRLPSGLRPGSSKRRVRAAFPGLSCVTAGSRGVCSVTRRRGRGVAMRFEVSAGQVRRVDVERLTTKLVPVLPRGRVMEVGRSGEGRRIRAVRLGDPDSPRKALVVGQTHGDEPEGVRVAQVLRGLRVRGIDLWVVDTVNPDGFARRQRQNASGVDLNRNFSAGWRRAGASGYRYYPGPRPFSAPESRMVRDLTDLLRPAVSIWYHQPYDYVITPIGGALRVVRRYGRLVGYPVRTPAPPRSPGQAPTWQNAAYPGTSAFIVELPPTALSPRERLRHARAAVVTSGGSPYSRTMR